MDIGTVAAWIQVGVWLFAGIIWLAKWRAGGASVHPMLKKYFLSNVTMGILILLGIGFSVESLWVRMDWRIGHRTLVVNASAYMQGTNNTLVMIQGQSFENEMIPLDGYAYKNVTFTNICFTYNGGSYMLQNVTLKDHWKVCVKNEDLKNYGDLAQTLQFFQPNLKHEDFFIPTPLSVSDTPKPALQ